jgi:uncharacterized protein (TIGR03435 family)
MLTFRFLCIILISIAGKGWQLPQRPIGSQPEGAATGPAFEVVSIKPWVPGSGRNGFGGGKRIQVDPSSLRMRTASVEEIIMYAYGLTWSDQLVGVPQGLGAYDVDAKTRAPSTAVEERMMLRAAIADRFRLTCHWAKKDGRAYALAVSGSSRLQPNSEAGEADSRLVSRAGGFGWSFKRISIGEFSEWLALRVNGPVVDNTGLTGRYDFELIMSRLDPQADGNAAPRSSGGGYFSVSDFISLLKPFGLRLTQSRGLLEILVVDHVEKPSEN